MSNVYNAQLEQALKKVNDQLDQKKLLETNKEQAAKLGVYFAHGLTQKAYNKLMNDTKESAFSGRQYHKASNSAEIVNNVKTAATAANTDAANARNAVSTAAVNIQAASNSLSNLAGDVSKVLSVAKAKDYGSKIEKMVKDAYTLTQSAADSAEDTSLDSLNATIEAAQTRASNTLSQAQTVSTDINNLVKILDTEFETDQAKINADLASLKTAQENENEQAGIYQTAKAEANALEDSEAFIEEYVNFDLLYHRKGDEGYKFDLSFKPILPIGKNFKHLYPPGEMAAAAQLMPTQKDIAEYRIIITTSNDSSTFDIRAAKATPEQNYLSIQEPSTKSKYWDQNTSSFVVDFVTSEFRIAHPNRPVKNLNLAKDYKGQPVKRGTDYVFFVYAIYTSEFQNKTEDTAGFLTLSSDDFQLETLLPTVRKSDGPYLSFFEKGNAPAARVTFQMNPEALKAPGVPDLNEIMEFRVFLFSEKDVFANALNHKIDDELKTLFEYESIYRQKEQEYLDAQNNYQVALATGDSTTAHLKFLENKMETSKGDYLTAKAKKDQQEKKVDTLNANKVSNFYIDNDVIDAIPVANGRAATRNDEFFSELQAQFDEYKMDQADTNKRLDKAKADTNKSKAAADAASKKIDADEKNIKKLKDELDASKAALMKDLKKLEDLLNKSEQDLTATEKSVRDSLASMNLSQAEEIIERLFELEAIDLRKVFLADLDVIKDTVKIEAKVKDINKAQTDLNKNKAAFAKAHSQWEADKAVQELVQSQLDEINDKVENLAEEMGELSGRTESSAESIAKQEADPEGKPKSPPIKEGATNNGNELFVATMDGDIVDNYGEPMQQGARYQALVYSTIDATKEPLAVPLFTSNMSHFSKPVTYRFETL